MIASLDDFFFILNDRVGREGLFYVILSAARRLYLLPANICKSTGAPNE
jgi:hypothetical protein